MRQARSVQWWLARRSRWQILLILSFSQSTDTKKLVALALLGFAALVFFSAFYFVPVDRNFVYPTGFRISRLCVRWYNNRKKPTALATP